MFLKDILAMILGQAEVDNRKMAYGFYALNLTAIGWFVSLIGVWVGPESRADALRDCHEGSGQMMILIFSAVILGNMAEHGFKAIRRNKVPAGA